MQVKFTIDYDLIEDFNCDLSSSLIRNYIINNDSMASSMINEKVDQYTSGMHMRCQKDLL